MGVSSDGAYCGAEEVRVEREILGLGVGSVRVILAVGYGGVVWFLEGFFFGLEGKRVASVSVEVPMTRTLSSTYPQVDTSGSNRVTKRINVGAIQCTTSGTFGCCRGRGSNGWRASPRGLWLCLLGLLVVI